MAEQQQLPLPGQDSEDELFAILNRIADRTGRQEFASRIGMSEGASSNALGRARRGDGRLVSVLPATALLVATLLPGGDELLAFLAGRSGMTVVTDTPATVEEEYVALVQVLQETIGGELHKGLLRAKKERVRANRGVLRVAK